MKILKKICALALTGCLFLCGSGFSNKYEDVQIIELKSNPSTGFVWNVEVVNLKSQEDDEKDNIEDEYIDMYDVCNTDDGYYIADGIITHNTHFCKYQKRNFDEVFGTDLHERAPIFKPIHKRKKKNTKKVSHSVTDKM